PDKAVSLLDTACARVALSQSATPPALEDCKRDIEFADIEMGILGREQAVSGGHEKRLRELQDRKKQAQERLQALQKQWQEEKDLVGQIRDLRGKLEAAAGGNGKAGRVEVATGPQPGEEQLRGELQALQKKLEGRQGETPLVQ